MATSHELLKVEGLRKTFQNGISSKTVIQGITFDLSSHDSLSIVGPSGCGKTTLLLMLTGLLKPTEGRLWLEAEPLTRPTSKIALVLQEYGLFPWKNVASNITLGARLQKIHLPEEELVSLKKELGIEGMDHLFPHQLSGGQRQRVALARALLLRPRLLLLDEPFAALDTITREHLQNHLLTLFDHRQFSFIVVTHNIEEAIFLGRRILILNDQPPDMMTVIDNPDWGTLDYRGNSEFFKRTLEIRRILKEIKWERDAG
jgi:NitT/TauT family transport system ATP-binding protein